LTASTTSGGNQRIGGQSQQLADTVDRRIGIALGIFGQQLVRQQSAVRPPGDDVGERAAAIDPEFPAGGRCDR
jgi:hypothetical protein